MHTKRKTPYFQSIIAKKITKKMLLIYLLIYVVILICLLMLVTPMLYNVSDNKAQNTVRMMSDDLSNAQESVLSYTSTLYSQEQLLSALSSFESNPNALDAALIEQSLSTYVSSNNLLLASTLEDFQHHYFSSYYYRNVVTEESALNDSHYQKLFQYPNGSYYAYIPNSEFFTSSNDGTIISFSYHALLYVRIIYFNQRPYILRSYYNISPVITHLETLSSDLFTDYAFFKSDDKINFTKGTLFQKNSNNLSSLFSYNNLSDHLEKNFGFYYYQKNINTNWILLAYSPFTMFFQNIITIALIITGLYFISPLLYALFLMPTTAKSLAPLKELSDAMTQYSAGDTVSLQINTKDEIENLSNEFQRMTVKINNQIKDIQQKEHMNAVVNYKLLATQVDPHFIYNTMNIINIMARQGNTSAIEEINSALIRILRERLNSKLSISDTIANELESLYQYRLIMNYRYNNKIHTQVDVDQALLPYKIPKNILQPLAENSFYHGFANLPENEEGHINILIYSVDDEIVIEISDDGAGIEEARLELLNSHSYHIYDDKKPHIGIDNIRQRLEYVYSGNYQFEIHSMVGYGTTISISLPAELSD